jgi:oligopeptidase B
MWHQVGKKVSSDVLVFEEKDPRFSVEFVLGDSHLFVGSVLLSHTTEWRMFDLNAPLKEPVLLLARTEGLEYYPGEVKNGVVFKTNLDGAENFQLKHCPWDDVGKDSSHWKSLLPHDTKQVLFDYLCFEKFVVVELIRNCDPHLLVVDLANPRNSYEIELEANGEPYEAIISFEQNALYRTPKFRLEFSTMTRPLQLLECHLAERTVRIVYEKRVVGYKQDKYESERVYAPSRDKKSHIPMSILKKKGGKTKYVFLEGYNAYGLGHEVCFSGWI